MWMCQSSSAHGWFDDCALIISHAEGRQVATVSVEASCTSRGLVTGSTCLGSRAAHASSGNAAMKGRVVGARSGLVAMCPYLECQRSDRREIRWIAPFGRSSPPHATLSHPQPLSAHSLSPIACARTYVCGCHQASLCSFLAVHDQDHP